VPQFAGFCGLSVLLTTGFAAASLRVEPRPARPRSAIIDKSSVLINEAQNPFYLLFVS
jgi:hypothetical protein